MRATMLSLMLVLMAACGSVAAAAPVTFVVGVEDLEYLPYYAYQNGRYGGIARDILDAYASARGLQFEYRVLPVKRLLHDFLAGTVDFKFPDNAYWAADVKQGFDINYSLPVVAYTDGVLVLPGRRGVGLVKLQVLATLRGFTPFTYSSQIAAGTIHVVEVDTTAALMKTVLTGRADGAYCNVLMAMRHLDKAMNLPDALIYDAELPHTDADYHLSTMRHIELMEDFNRFLADQGELIAGLRKKWELP